MGPFIGPPPGLMNAIFNSMLDAVNPMERNANPFLGFGKPALVEIQEIGGMGGMGGPMGGMGGPMGGPMGVPMGGMGGPPIEMLEEIMGMGMPGSMQMPRPGEGQTITKTIHITRDPKHPGHITKEVQTVITNTGHG